MSDSAAEEIFEAFEIVFDAGPEPIFHGGELITGSLKIQLKKQITIKAIRLQFKGRACWLGDALKGGEVEKVYFDKDFVLLERPPGNPKPGHFQWNASFPYSLPFECPLPKGCPTSYEGPQAFIRYFARATLQTDEVDPTQYMVKKGFSIISPPELRSLLPPKSEPAHVGDTFTFGGCCCRGKVTAHVTLPKSAYAPGEDIIGTVTVDNRHPRHIIEQIEVRLVDKVRKIGGTNNESSPAKPSANHRVILHRKLERSDVIKSKSAVQVDDVLLLTVPPVCPTTHTDEKNAPPTPEIIHQLDPDGQVAKLLESPSTATLKMRKQPFIRLEYALQVSLGVHVLIEVPIQIHAIPIYANGISFKPFAAGAQVFTESDETDKKLFGAPFSFTPMYPTYNTSPVHVDPVTKKEVTHETNAVPNGHADVTKTVERTELPDGSTIIRHTEERIETREYGVAEDGITTAEKEVPEVHILERQPEIIAERITQPDSDYAVEQSKAELSEEVLHDNGVEDQVVSAALDTIQHGEVVEHHETDEQISNGHVHTIIETIQDGPATTERKVENIEYTDENGVKVIVQKTSEHTQMSTTTVTNGVAAE
jgi:hypothetical protein